MIYQAVFGDKDGSYTLLDTDHPDRSVPARICNSTDLRSRPNDGVIWKSSVRGFPVGEHYVVMRTYLDTTPGVRHNRVFTHSCIIQLQHVHEFDLQSLLSVFSLYFFKDVKIEKLDLEKLKSHGLRSNPSNKLAKVWRGLLQEKIVVWLGEDDFQTAVVDLWANMPIKFRKEFEFELSFNPSQIESKGKYVLINSPSTQRHRWENDRRFLVVNLEEQELQPDDLELFLAGAPVSMELRKFVTEANFQVDDFEKLKAVNAIYRAFTETEKCDFNKANTALILTQKYMLEGKTSQVVKERLFGRMEELLRVANAQLISAVRKLKVVSSIEDSEMRLCAALYHWCENNVFDVQKNNSEKVYLVVDYLMESDSQQWWQATIRQFLARETTNWSDEKATVLTGWLGSEKSERVFQVLKNDIIKNKKAIEVRTAEAILNNLSDAHVSKFQIEFANNKLFILHAAVLLLSESDNNKILESQLVVESKDTPLDSLMFLKQKIGSERFFVASLVQKIDTRLIGIAASILEKELPTISKHLLITREFDQEVLVVISRSSPIQNYFKNFLQAVVYPLLDQILKGSHFNATIKLIAKFDTDLLNYPNRSKIWTLVNPINLTLIKNTAKVYLENLDVHNVSAIEPALRSEILSSETIGWYLGKYKRNMQKALDLFENFHEIVEQRLQDFLYFYDSEITSIESKRLGELVRDRKWKMCAGIIYSKCKEDLSSFRVALNHCFDELSLLDRLAASWHGYANNGRINESDFWSSLHEVACRLFPEGPRHNKVWKESGGDNSDLLMYGSGKEIWKDALSKLKSGAFNGITVKSLMNTMLDLYPNNRELKFLKKIRKELWRES